MTIKEFCIQFSLFWGSLFAQKEKEEDLADPEELTEVREQEAEERRQKVQRDFMRIAFGAGMGHVISWGKSKEEDREEFIEKYGRGGSDI